MIEKLITPSSPERVTLADVYFHFVALSPSPRQATIELAQVIREGRLELAAGKITELRPGGAQQGISHNKVIEPTALLDRLRMTFDWEFSRAIWKNPPPGSYFMFENITAARDQVVALRPLPSITPTATSLQRGRRAKFNWDLLVAEVIYRAHEIGPSALASDLRLAEDLVRWCERQGLKEIPEIDTVRKKLRIWLSRYPRRN